MKDKELKIIDKNHGALTAWASTYFKLRLIISEKEYNKILDWFIDNKLIGAHLYVYYKDICKSNMITFYSTIDRAINFNKKLIIDNPDDRNNIKFNFV